MTPPPSGKSTAASHPGGKGGGSPENQVMVKAGRLSLAGNLYSTRDIRGNVWALAAGSYSGSVTASMLSGNPISSAQNTGSIKCGPWSPSIPVPKSSQFLQRRGRYIGL